MQNALEKELNDGREMANQLEHDRSEVLRLRRREDGTRKRRDDQDRIAIDQERRRREEDIQAALKRKEGEAKRPRNAIESIEPPRESQLF